MSCDHSQLPSPAQSSGQRAFILGKRPLHAACPDVATKLGPYCWAASKMATEERCTDDLNMMSCSFASVSSAICAQTDMPKPLHAHVQERANVLIQL